MIVEALSRYRTRRPHSSTSSTLICVPCRAPVRVLSVLSCTDLQLERFWPFCCSPRSAVSRTSRIVYLCSSSSLVSARHPPPRKITVTSHRGGANAVAAANDFATTVLQDPWDMNQRTDVGWFVNSVDLPLAGFSSATFASGLFSGRVAARSQSLAARNGIAGAAPVGKIRQQLSDQREPVSESRRAHVRSQATATCCSRWSTNTIFDPPGLHTRTTSSPRPAGASTSSIWRRSG